MTTTPRLSQVPLRNRLIQFIAMWIAGSLLVILPVWVLIGPDVIMIAGTFLGIVFGSTVRKHLTELRPQWRQLQINVVAAAIIVMAAITTAVGLFAILQPTCSWLKRAETVEIQFLNRELIYGFTLCYPPGTVDYFSLIAIVVFEYFVLYLIIGLFMAIAKLFGLLGRAIGSIAAWVQST